MNRADSAKMILRSRRVLTDEGLRPASVHIVDGIISEIGDYGFKRSSTRFEDWNNHVIMPGLVDTHVHVNQPGRTSWEGFSTATRAAAAGGITTIVDMPLNCIPVTTTSAAFNKKLAATRGQLWVDCGFWGGVVPGNWRRLNRMIDDGVAGFKAFLIHSGIDDFPNVSEADLNKAMPILARRNVPLLVHAELCTTHDNRARSPGGAIDGRYRAYLNSRPKKWENDAIRLMIRLSRKHSCRVHIVHLSSAEAVAMIASAQRDGVPITAETCPHYLYFSAEKIPDRHTEFKCAPPIRDNRNRERLWSALKRGVIRLVVSDHSPCTPDLKAAESGDFSKAWGGISSVQFTLPAVWTEARRRSVSFIEVARWMSLAPADFAGLGGSKGRLRPGYDADLTVWDPDTSFRVDSKNIYHRHKLTPYLGRTLYGKVRATFVRGKRVYRDETFAGPHGQPIRVLRPSLD